MGLFWVGVQAALGRRAGEPGARRAFVGQYALYVAGTATGGATTGGVIAAAHALGAGDVGSARASFLVGAVAAAATLAASVPWARSAAPASRAAQPVRRGALHGLALQLPALMLVSAMGMLLSLTPVVLRDDFRVRPIVIGVVSGLVAAAKAGGSVTAGRFAAARGSRDAVAAMLAGSALAAGLLIGVDRAWLFVGLVLAATFFGIGVWPVVVDGALARVSPDTRRELSVAWNVREYAAIAGTTALGGYLLDASGSRRLLLELAALLLAAGAVSALATLRRPIYSAEPA
jgi:predicted MFS family arabinose efflux permease